MELYKICTLYQGKNNTETQSIAASYLLSKEEPMDKKEFDQLIQNMFIKHDNYIIKIIDDLINNHNFQKPKYHSVNLIVTDSIAETRKRCGI